MAIEHAAAQVMRKPWEIRKPWGVAELRPWSGTDGSADAIGELWLSGPDPAISLLQDSKNFGERMTLSVGVFTAPAPKSNGIVEAQT